MISDMERLLKRLVLTQSNAPQTDFCITPWKDAPLITPQHTVRL
jgi:hypothetical protein